MVSEVFSIAGAMIGSVGGAAFIIVALSTWLGKVWANRILEQDRLKYASGLEQIKNKLNSERERSQFVFSLYFEGQFKIYNDLWAALVELQYGVERLWKEASRQNLQKFIKALQEATPQIKKSALLIEPEHYNEIMNALRTFEGYRVGKERLVFVRRSENLDRGQIQEVIDNNRGNRDIINSFTDSMLQKMRERLCKAGVVLPGN
ncbi:MAG: hypothetical protein H3C64_05265 [Candidatus Kuenenia stuttgartiensis]|uniref:Uncharacterized protein n=1 Tax=Kuenenia stuttgartiensis TaxID=174633 RepID=A0A2C9CFI5_KUEST|nr:hypothetical protein [Candidatus Kuenenia stuttgartiensis]MCZ7611785.1 hypothetical protein [Ignavibacterium sp.]MBW7941809.1 hypothetical protein [Candidatus Kuenenia stuttgartiensis]MBZ0192665.1 hypothetical protein [Candidatus Kuenenia stuttgartiensis]SOH04451.1 hypothetical protein KSMBR1_1953 [Candidatus Kuenenia stuttgartiensis]GJQ50485.1 MAG: hypothetical protein HKUEN01_28710 [Candidatus Kuenenia stuttgartiensis]